MRPADQQVEVRREPGELVVGVAVDHLAVDLDSGGDLGHRAGEAARQVVAGGLLELAVAPGEAEDHGGRRLHDAEDLNRRAGPGRDADGGGERLIRLGLGGEADADATDHAGLRRAVATRRDRDRAGRAAEQSLADAAGDHATQCPAVRGPDDDGQRVLLFRDRLQPAGDRSGWDGARLRDRAAEGKRDPLEGGVGLVCQRRGMGGRRHERRPGVDEVDGDEEKLPPSDRASVRPRATASRDRSERSTPTMMGPDAVLRSRGMPP